MGPTSHQPWDRNLSSGVDQYFAKYFAKILAKYFANLKPPSINTFKLCQQSFAKIPLLDFAKPQSPATTGFEALFGSTLPKK
jgi:hypothetical protein